MATQYLCECAYCQGSNNYVSYSTTRRHLSTYGSKETVQERSSTGENNGTVGNHLYDNGKQHKNDTTVHILLGISPYDCIEVALKLGKQHNRMTQQFTYLCSILIILNGVYLNALDNEETEGRNDEDILGKYFEGDEMDFSYDNETVVDMDLMEYTDDIPEYDDVESDSNDESDHESVASESVDAINLYGADDPGKDDQDSRSLLSTVLIIFFRIIHHFKISNNAASVILSFISFLLGMIAHPMSQVFPKNVSSALRDADANDTVNKQVYVVCPNEACSALYQNCDSNRKCTQVSFGKVCRSVLGYSSNLSHGKKKWKPHKVFQFIPPSSSLRKMFQSQEFLDLLHDANSRSRLDDVLEDFQDGQIWQDFSDSNFFKSRFNVGLMFNVDWFHPYKRSEYKVSALILTVLNLPREVRFKKKWTIIAGIIPGPHEPTGNINTYLKPLVDDLLDLWDGVPLHEGSEHVLRAALMAVTADLPAMRKVTQFLGHKANLGCPRCKFSAEREPLTIGASGQMSYFTPTMAAGRCHEEVVQQAEEYRSATTKSNAASIGKKNGVRYSELIRLPYFDTVRMCTTDPMHTFLLGMVKRETELNVDLLTTAQREEFVRRIKSVQMPYDVGRLPTNIFDHGHGLSGVTAAQWKLFIACYARPCLYKLIPRSNYRCMVLLSQIVCLMSSPVLSMEDVATLFRLQHDHHELFCKLYGKWNVTVNYHTSLHLADVIYDFGPPQSFWCFSYERFNGILAGAPNSGRCVEVEVPNRFVRDISFSYCDICSISSIPHIMRDFVSSDQDEVQPYPQTFRVLRALNNIADESYSRLETQLALDRGEVDESWPMEFKHPTKLNVRINQSFSSEIWSYLKDLYGNDLEYVQPRINKYGRCSVNGQNFSSQFNSSDRGSIVKSMFVDQDDELFPFYGAVRFYFTIKCLVTQEPVALDLAYVTWFKFRSSNREPLSELHGVTKDLYLRDRIISPRRFLCRCVLVTPNPAVNFSLVSELLK